MDVRLRRAMRLPKALILHAGSAAVPVRVRPLGADTVRLNLARPLPVHIGDHGVLRDPGAQRVATGVVVLDPLPPALARRGGAPRRALELAEMNGQPDLVGEIRRRGAVRRGDLILAGVPVSPGALPGESVAAGDWLIDTERWDGWRKKLVLAVRDWAEAHPLQPSMPRQAAGAQLELPDPALLDALVPQEPDLVLDGEGVHRRGQKAALPPAVERELGRVLGRLDARPFDAPEVPELEAAGLNEKLLAVATREGRLVRVAAGVYLRPTALDEAVHRLSQLAQPFTMAQARQALDTTRRVAVPLLELLDRSRKTVRVDSQTRRVRD
jgi:selenocysteine-specific elongation factor